MVTVTQDEPTEKKPRTPSNLTVRVITGLALMPLVLAAMVVGGWVWTGLLALVIGIGLLEFFFLAHGHWSQGSAVVGIPAGLAVLLAFHADEPLAAFAAVLVGGAMTLILETLRHPGDIRRSIWQVVTTLTGILYVGFPLAFLAAVRSFEDGIVWILAIFALTWGADTCAYFGGRLWGKRQLAPRLSPKKTVEGALAGLVGGFAPALLLLVLDGKLNATTLVWITMAPFVAILGDLLESAMKRFFHVKDSHVRGLNIIPGHGGVLDRIDALLLVSAFSYLLIVLTGIAT